MTRNLKEVVSQVWWCVPVMPCLGAEARQSLQNGGLPWLHSGIVQGQPGLSQKDFKNFHGFLQNLNEVCASLEAPLSQDYVNILLLLTQCVSCSLSYTSKPTLLGCLLGTCMVQRERARCGPRSVVAGGICRAVNQPPSPHLQTMSPVSADVASLVFYPMSPTILVSRGSSLEPTACLSFCILSFRCRRPWLSKSCVPRVPPAGSLHPPDSGLTQAVTFP